MSEPDIRAELIRICKAVEEAQRSRTLAGTIYLGKIEYAALRSTASIDFAGSEREMYYGLRVFKVDEPRHLFVAPA